MQMHFVLQLQIHLQQQLEIHFVYILMPLTLLFLHCIARVPVISFISKHFVFFLANLLSALLLVLPLFIEQSRRIFIDDAMTTATL